MLWWLIIFFHKNLIYKLTNFNLAYHKQLHYFQFRSFENLISQTFFIFFYWIWSSFFDHYKGFWPFGLFHNTHQLVTDWLEEPSTNCLRPTHTYERHESHFWLDRILNFCTVRKIYTPIFSFFQKRVVIITSLELGPVSNERSGNFIITNV